MRMSRKEGRDLSYKFTATEPSTERGALKEELEEFLCLRGVDSLPSSTPSKGLQNRTSSSITQQLSKMQILWLRPGPVESETLWVDSAPTL